MTKTYPPESDEPTLCRGIIPPYLSNPVHRVSSMAAIGEYYRILGVSGDAETDDIKKAFRKLARSCHPDVAGDDPSGGQSPRFVPRDAGGSDPSAKYDRRHQRMEERRNKSHTVGTAPWRVGRILGHSKARAARRSRHQQSDITLDDIFTQGGRPRTASWKRASTGRCRSAGATDPAMSWLTSASPSMFRDARRD